MTDLSDAHVLALRRGIAEQQLDAVADLIVADAAACYAMVVEGPGDDGMIGTTRFGGAPDLPPAWRGRATAIRTIRPAVSRTSWRRSTSPSCRHSDQTARCRVAVSSISSSRP